jgi:hypothetical protein
MNHVQMFQSACMLPFTVLVLLTITVVIVLTSDVPAYNRFVDVWNGALEAADERILLPCDRWLKGAEVDIQWNDGGVAGFEEPDGKKTLIFRTQLKDKNMGELCTVDKFLEIFPVGGKISTKNVIYRRTAHSVREVLEELKTNQKK